MSSPIHIAWFNYPRVGEYGAWRVHGSHQGFDSYTLPKATIYGTAGNGEVIGKGYDASGWGHWIDVYYPASGTRSEYVQRDCHMHEASGLRAGAAVGTGTALGRVGRTGNAKNIYWIREGIELWHVHSEVYLSRLVQFAKRTNPLPVWGVTTAGGTGIPITPDEEEPENDMRIIYDTENSNQDAKRALTGEHTFRVLTEAEAITLGKSGIKTHNVASAEWVEIAALVAENRARFAQTQGLRLRVLFNVDDSNDATRRAVAGPGVFRAITATESTGERRVWGEPVNVKQAQWDAEKAAALAPAGVAGVDLTPILTAIEAIKPPSAESIFQRFKAFWATGK